MIVKMTKNCHFVDKEGQWLYSGISNDGLITSLQAYRQVYFKQWNPYLHEDTVNMSLMKEDEISLLLF